MFQSQQAVEFGSFSYVVLALELSTEERSGVMEQIHQGQARQRRPWRPSREAIV